MSYQLHTLRGGYIGNPPTTNEDELLYPIDPAPKGQTIPDENLQFLQRFADENEILLPTEFNVSIPFRKIHSSDRATDGEEPLYPAGINPNSTCLDCD